MPLHLQEGVEEKHKTLSVYTVTTATDATDSMGAHTIMISSN